MRSSLPRRSQSNTDTVRMESWGKVASNSKHLPKTWGKRTKSIKIDTKNSNENQLYEKQSLHHHNKKAEQRQQQQ